MTVEILKADTKVFGTRGMHISDHRSSLFKPNPFVWLNPAGKKGSVDASGMWQFCNPDVAKDDIFQISFYSYFLHGGNMTTETLSNKKTEGHFNNVKCSIFSAATSGSVLTMWVRSKPGALFLELTTGNYPSNARGGQCFATL